jgi:hypothetical protein
MVEIGATCEGRGYGPVDALDGPTNGSSSRIVFYFPFRPHIY